MAQNPLNLALRFILELVALYSVGYWGWTAHSGPRRYLLVIGLPLLAAVLWGTFRVPGDASASGEALVAVPGIVRLALELALFGGATWGLYAAGATRSALLLGVITLIHYALSYDRILWLLSGDA